MSNNKVIVLGDLEVGGRGTVVRLEGGRGFIGRMVALGFNPGVTVDVTRNHRSGPIIVNVMDTQMAVKCVDKRARHG